ncbi:MAG: glutathione S-transferase N-terminal domain-containing protein [Burkholderiales bacterium]|nr:glutathione S-transferase N-terminal domain-containing protein [Burkholderiales bacterium]
MPATELCFLRSCGCALSLSRRCAETILLRMAGLPYECPRGANHMRAPKGKLPYIEDNGRLIADSTFVIDYLNSPMRCGRRSR